MRGTLFSCKGGCHKHRGRRSGNSSPYDKGLFKCSSCDLFMTEDGIRRGNNRILCRCCGGPVKTHRRRYNAGGKLLQELRTAGSRI